MRFEQKSELEKICNYLRSSIFKITKNAESGHVGGCSSSVELMTALYFGKILNYDPKNPSWEGRDRVLVRGHLGPLRYSIFSILKWINKSELNDYRKINSRLEGHEDMNKIPGVDITPSGSLGMLLSYGAGAGISAIKNKKSFLTYVFLGDGEEQEGNVSEAARHISSLGLNNIVVIIDKNKKQLSRGTSESDKNSKLKLIWEGYGWDVKEVNGHDLEEIIKTYNWGIKREKKPKMIIAHTLKGKGIYNCESHYNGYHTLGVIPPKYIDDAILNYEKINSNLKIEELVKEIFKISKKKEDKITQKKEKFTDLISENKDYPNLIGGLTEYLNKLNIQFAEKRKNLYFLTADILRKDIIPSLGLNNPNTLFIDGGIREQHLTAMSHGIIQTDKDASVILYVGEEFLYRNADQINVLCQGKSPVVILGNMGGICGGKNGPTHQPTGQSGMLTLMNGLDVLEPYNTEDLFNSLNFALSNKNNPTYIRMHTGKIDPLIGINSNIRNYIIKDSKNPEVVLVSNGLTLNGCIEAYELLKLEGIESRVINVINRGKLDEEFVSRLVPEKPVITVYNGNEKSLGYPVSEAIMKCPELKRPSKLISHGFDYGKSGSIEDLIKYFKFDGKNIVEIVKTNLKIN